MPLLAASYHCMAVPVAVKSATVWLTLEQKVWDAVPVGAASPLMITENEQVASGEQPLLAVMVTTVVPSLNVEPLPVPFPLAVVAPLNV